MKLFIRVILNLGLSISMLFGLWHFFIPYMFNWYSYIPNAPRAIIVSIDWINFFFSLLLFGISVLLLIQQKQIINKSKNTYSFFGLLLTTWFLRIIITIIHPWNVEYRLIDIMQITVFIFILFLLITPFLYYILNKEDQK